MRRIRPILAIVALMAVAGAACSKDTAVATDMDAVGAFQEAGVEVFLVL